MQKWKGSYEDLQAIVEGTREPGEWRELPDKYEFRAQEGGILCWWPTTGTIAYQGPASARDALRAAVDQSSDEFKVASGSAPKPIAKAQKHIFLVHGHDKEALDQLELVIHRLDLKPFVLMNTSGAGLTIIEALERQIGQKPEAEFGIVLVTPDDLGYAADEGTTAAKPRARQNVVLEMGMLMSSLGRNRVAILVKGYVELPSNAQGIIYLRYDRHIRDVVPKLAERLQAAGFVLKPENITYACN
ncbi:MAG: nucleotide-binding protein [Candidatus Eremiobacteraeota bacterium]|nr:nucleotide-binding protein [Candidatus Eremiobacteraeota bacterium]